MKFSDMKTLLEFYVDDIVDTKTAIILFNAGKDKMAAAVNAKFPNLPDQTIGEEEFVFDSRFHELPVLYAAAMVKSYDSSIREKESYDAQFRDGIREFVENYDPPIQYLDNELVKHITVTDPLGQSNFKITAANYNRYSDVNVYVNSELVPFQSIGSEITLLDPAPEGSVVTLTWNPDVYSAEPWMKVW